jgi:hypothetical protein
MATVNTVDLQRHTNRPRAASMTEDTAPELARPGTFVALDRAA